MGGELGRGFLGYPEQRNQTILKKCILSRRRFTYGDIRRRVEFLFGEDCRRVGTTPQIAIDLAIQLAKISEDFLAALDSLAGLIQTFQKLGVLARSFPAQPQIVRQRPATTYEVLLP